MIYWDSSVILKLYVSEGDSDEWQARVMKAGAPLYTSALVQAEIAFALRQKEVRGEIKPGAAEKLAKIFREDVTAGRIQVFPVGGDVLEACAELDGRGRGTEMPLVRTLDGIHLATAGLLKCRTVATADARMKTAAAALGFSVYP